MQCKFDHSRRLLCALMVTIVHRTVEFLLFIKCINGVKRRPDVIDRKKKLVAALHKYEKCVFCICLHFGSTTATHFK